MFTSVKGTPFVAFVDLLSPFAPLREQFQVISRMPKTAYGMPEMDTHMPKTAYGKVTKSVDIVSISLYIW